MLSRILLLAILLLTAVSLVATLTDLGTFVDEIWYFRAAYLIEDWVARVVRGEAPVLAADPAVWEYNSEHPPFSKWVYALFDRVFGPGPSFERHGSYRVEQIDDNPPLLRPPWGLMGPVGGMRLGGLAFFLLAQVSLFALVRREEGDSAGLFAAAALPTMPRLFGHAHFACIDLPVAAMILASLVLLVRVVLAPRVTAGGVIGVSLVFGLAVATKFNAAFMALAVTPWALIVRPRRALIVLPAVGLGALIVFVAVWPYLWADPVGRIGDLIRFHLEHRRFPAYFLGTIYDTERTPWTYMPFMTASTMPIVLLALAVAGIAGLRRGRPVRALMVLAAGAAMAPLAVSRAPIYDGLRHYLVTPLLLAGLAGMAFAGGVRALRDRGVWNRLPEGVRPYAPMVAAILLLAPGVVSVASVHPYPLAYYNALVGGPRAAMPPPDGMGLEATVWGAEAVGSEVVDWLNENLPPGSSIHVTSGAYTSLREYRRYQMLRADLWFQPGAQYWILTTNQEYWTQPQYWDLFLEGESERYELVKSFGPASMDVVRVYRSKAGANQPPPARSTAPSAPTPRR